MTDKNINNQIPVVNIDSKGEIKNLIHDGLWKNNSSLVQLIGLCPLLAVSNNVVNALGLGIATTLVLIATNLIISSLRGVIPQDIRIPIYVMVIAALVSSVELLLKAYSFQLYLALGIFIPLIVTNCIIIGRAEAYAIKNSVKKSVVDGIATGVGLSVVIVVLGGVREFLATGNLFANMNLLFGELGSKMELKIFNFDHGFILAILPPGAFIGLGLLVALKNYIDNRIKTKQK